MIHIIHDLEREENFFHYFLKKRLTRRVNVFNLWAKHRASLKSKRELSFAVLNFNFNTDIIVVVVVVFETLINLYFSLSLSNYLPVVLAN